MIRPRLVLRVLVLLVVACRGAAPAPGLDVHVDRRVELLAVLQRLADGNEYLTSPSTSYVHDVDTHFAPFGSKRG